MEIAIEANGFISDVRLPHPHFATLEQIAQFVLILHHLFAHQSHLLVVQTALAVHLALVAFVAGGNHTIDDISTIVLDGAHTYLDIVGHSVVGGVGIRAEVQILFGSAVDDSRKGREVVYRGRGK